MVCEKEIASEKIYFKPDLKISYKALNNAKEGKKGHFQCYRFNNKETFNLDELKTIAIRKLQVFENDLYISQIMPSLFDGEIILRNKTDYSLHGIIKWDSKERVFIGAEGQFVNFGKVQSTLRIAGILLTTGESFYLDIKGLPKMELDRIKKDKSNKEKVDILNNSNFIRFYPNKEIITAGQKPMQRNINLLEVESLDDKFTLSEEQIEEIEEINRIINEELRNYKDGTALTKEESKKVEDISSVFTDTEEEAPF